MNWKLNVMYNEIQEMYDERDRIHNMIDIYGKFIKHSKEDLEEAMS